MKCGVRAFPIPSQPSLSSNVFQVSDRTAGTPPYVDLIIFFLSVKTENVAPKQGFQRMFFCRQM